MRTRPVSRPLILTTLVAAALLAGCKPGADAPAPAEPAAAPAPAPAITDNWMSWQDGVDLVAVTDPSLTQPNVIIHLAGAVHTPFGTAPSGMVLYQPDPKAPPVVMGFVSADPTVGGYFGPTIFAGTPFEKAPALKAEITTTKYADTAVSTVKVEGHTFEVTLAEIGPLTHVDRPAGSPMPFAQDTLEAAAAKATLKVDGKPVAITLPPAGLSGGSAAVWAPAGIYAR